MRSAGKRTRDRNAKHLIMLHSARDGPIESVCYEICKIKMPTLSQKSDKGGAPIRITKSFLALRGFDQLHLAVAGAVQDHHLALGIAEDEDVAVAEVGFFDGLFQRHGAHGDGFIGAN